MLAPLIGLPRQSEILIIIFLGICFLSLDFSLFEITANLKEVWKLKLNEARQFETIVKYVISAVIIARTFTLHIYLACYVVMLWPSIFEEKPTLMLPWLLLGIIRCIILNIITFSVGTFICYKERGISPICMEFILAQVIDHGPSVYAWISVLSFYRSLAAEKDSNQCSEESFLSDTQSSLESRDSNNNENNGSWDISKSYSLSDLNLDYMHSSRFKSLSGDLSINVLIEELRHLISHTRIMHDSSKSSNFLFQTKSDSSDVFENFSKEGLTIIEKAMKILDISEQDVTTAQQDKQKMIQILKCVKREDVNKIDEDIHKVTSSSFYIRNGEIREGTKMNVPKSLSLHEEQKGGSSCLCYLRRQLQKEQSKLSLVESEIACIQFDETDKDTESQKDGRNCAANSKTIKCERNMTETEPKGSLANGKSLGEDITGTYIKNDILNTLNKYRVVVGASLRLNKTSFLHQFVLKRNTSKNFGCQVSLLENRFLSHSRNELAKKLFVFRNCKLL